MRIFPNSSSSYFVQLKPYLHCQLESDDDGGDGDRNEEEEPDLAAVAVGVQAEGQHERDEVTQPLSEIS